MDFILGIFTGISLMIGLGIWLNERAKKRIDARIAREYYHKSKNPMSMVPDEMSQWLGKVVRDPRTAAEQLSDAIAREDFKEAARLMDLINKR